MTSNSAIEICRIRFPEVKLKTRDGHKLRGFFGSLFREHSPLLHNHYSDGSLRYRYPLIQYKVIDNIPMLVGIAEGAKLLPQLFLKIQTIELDDVSYPINRKNIEMINEPIGYSDSLISYTFNSLWMGLNQRNYDFYSKMDNLAEKRQLLEKILVGNILGLYSNLGHTLLPEERLLANVELSEKTTQFKNRTMLAFKGKFIVNAFLPDYLGIGKSVSRGFGTITKTS